MAYASLPSRGRAAPRESFDSHCSRDCQQARRWCSSRLRPGTRRAALQPSARSLAAMPKMFLCAGSRRVTAPVAWRDNSAPSRRGFAGPLFDHNSRRLPGQRTAAAEAAAGGSRSAARLGADHEDPPSNSTTAHTTACFAHTHRLAPHRARGRTTYQPPECQLAIPPRAERGSSELTRSARWPSSS